MYTLIQQPDGEYFVKILNQLASLGTDQQAALAIVERIDDAYDPILVVRNGILLCCFNEHEKDESCTYERLN